MGKKYWPLFAIYTTDRYVNRYSNKFRRRVDCLSVAQVNMFVDLLVDILTGPSIFFLQLIHSIPPLLLFHLLFKLKTSLKLSREVFQFSFPKPTVGVIYIAGQWIQTSSGTINVGNCNITYFISNGQQCQREMVTNLLTKPNTNCR